MRSIEKQLARIPDSERKELYADRKCRLQGGFLSGILLGHEILRRHPKMGLKDAYDIAVEMRRMEEKMKTRKH